jgi:excisionase family DNA binding protein
MKAIQTTPNTETSLDDSLCLRVGRVAEVLDCSVSKVYTLIRDGHLDSIKLSGSKKAGTRVLSSSLNRFLRDGGVIDAKEMTPADRVNSQRHRLRRSSAEWF